MKKVKFNFSPVEAEKILIEGNKRFVCGNLAFKNLSLDIRSELYNGQHPLAVVLTCSDSRVPPELIFDQGLGDVFVIRNAGNVVSSIELGTIEYALQILNVPLVVVLGHENCGAVKAAVDDGRGDSNIQSIIDNIIPSIKKVKLHNKNASNEKIASLVEDENIKESAKKLLTSPIIKNLVDKNEVKLLTAKYHLKTGEVIFFK
jgi:carbonic anhydrase